VWVRPRRGAHRRGAPEGQGAKGSDTRSWDRFTGCGRGPTPGAGYSCSPSKFEFFSRHGSRRSRHAVNRGGDEEMWPAPTTPVSRSSSTLSYVKPNILGIPAMRDALRRTVCKRDRRTSPRRRCGLRRPPRGFIAVRTGRRAGPTASDQAVPIRGGGLPAGGLCTAMDQRPSASEALWPPAAPGRQPDVGSASEGGVGVGI